jgi:threonine/homoserine/homoserine lactone efflux protein
MLEFLSAGTFLGLAAGLSPGPLLILVISETLRHNMKAGVIVALAPLVTDIPIVFLAVFILSKLSHLAAILGGISIFGGLFVMYLGYESMRTTGVKLDFMEVNPKSFRKGIITNALSPHPYLFWVTVGTPIIMKALADSTQSATVFVGSFYLSLVGIKVILAIIAGKSSSFLKGKIYIYCMRVLGLLLFLFSILLFRDGLRLLGA